MIFLDQMLENLPPHTNNYLLYIAKNYTTDRLN